MSQPLCHLPSTYGAEQIPALEATAAKAVAESTYAFEDMLLLGACSSLRSLSHSHTHTSSHHLTPVHSLSLPLLHARTTAKAYQLNPASVNETLYLQVLIKALTRLAEPTPAHDFVLLSAVLPLGLHADARFAQLQALKTNLDRAEFPQFWTGVEASQDLFDSVPGAIGAFRGYVATVLERCFQRVPQGVLFASLGLSTGARTLETFIASRSGCGWTVGKFPDAAEGAVVETSTGGGACIIFPTTGSNQPQETKFQSSFELHELSSFISELSSSGKK